VLKSGTNYVKKNKDSGEKTEEDRDLWEFITRSIKPYPGALKEIKSASRQKAKPEPSPAPIRPAGAAAQKSGEGFDRSTATRLKRGQLALEGRIDLHGMTQREAFDALGGFILKSVAQKKRTVLVITGKGLRSEGVLRRMVPLWLGEGDLKPHILAVTEAQPKDGGTGAFYVRLRKERG
jgi:DNA-nicking Smr family endonuclease